jgi:pimeloyl-ACP methyl ester carboxylesterase
MKTFFKTITVALIFSTIIIQSCKEEEIDKGPIVPVVLIDQQFLVKKTNAEIKSFIASKKLPIATSEIKYDVDIYKVTYKTSYKDDAIIASGLVALPATNDQVGILSFQHGTISLHSDAPTEQGATTDILQFYASMASVGFVAIIPDYIGFGASKQITHPYYVEKPTAVAVLDNIRAGRELALVNNINLNKRLFLAGYSQGGYATMAAHKAIEEQQGIEDLNLIASFPAAGGYDITGMQKYLFNLKTYHEPFYLSYIGVAYKSYYNTWNESLNVMFKEPFASKIPLLFDGTKSGSQINSELTENIEDLVQPEVLANIDTDIKYKFITDAFIENSVTDWIPKAPVYMYHGSSDITVPYQNSVDTYNNFINNGASSTVVTMTPLPFATHGTGITP